MKVHRFYLREILLLGRIDNFLFGSQHHCSDVPMLPFHTFWRLLSPIPCGSPSSRSVSICTNVASQSEFPVSSIRDFKTWTIKSFSRLNSAVSEAFEPAQKHCEGSFKGRASVKRTVCVALQNYLIIKNGIPEFEAASMVKNAPRFLKKLLARAQKDRFLKQNLLVTKVPSEEFENDGCLELQSRVDAFLDQQDINEIEVFFETIGLKDNSVLRDIVASVDRGLKLLGEDGLLVNIQLLQSLGVPRKRMWRLYDRDRKLLECSYTDLCASIRVLENLGVQRKALPALVQACPSVLRIDVEETMRDVLKYMEDLGIEKNFVGKLLQYNPQEVLQARHTHFGEKMQFLLDCGLSKDRVIRMLREFPQLLIMSLEQHLKPSIEFLCSLGLRKEQVGKIIAGSPQILSYSVKRNLLPKIAYLESVGVERRNFAPILMKFPGIFGHSIEDCMLPKVKFLESLGVERKNMGRIITLFPSILGYSIEENLVPKLKFFESIGMERASFGRVITRSPSILGLSVEQNLKPKVAFFEENGVKGKDIAKLFTSHPSVVGRAIDGSLGIKLKFLSSLGLELKTSAMARALVACAAQSVTSLEMKCNSLLQMGFPQKALLNLVAQQPTLLHLCKDHLLSKVKFYTEEVGLSVGDVCPPLLSYSLEGRIKPRYKWITLLRSNGLLNREYPMTTIMSISEKKFLGKFVHPFPQISQSGGAWSLPALADKPSSMFTMKVVKYHDS